MNRFKIGAALASIALAQMFSPFALAAECDGKQGDCSPPSKPSHSGLELVSQSGFGVAVGIDPKPHSGNNDLLTLDPSQIWFGAFSQNKVANVTIYGTIVAVGGKSRTGTVLANFGCGIGNLPLLDGAKFNVYSGASCNYVPIIVGPMTYPRGHILHAVVNVTYQNAGGDGPTIRTTSKMVRTLVNGKPSETDADPTKNPQAEIRGKKFVAELQMTNAALAADGSLNLSKTAIFVMARERADNVAVLLSVQEPASTPERPNPPTINISCGVGSLEQGQAVVYSGLSCNYPPMGLKFPSRKPLMQVSVLYADGQTCWSNQVPVPVIAEPPSTAFPSGMHFAIYQKDDPDSLKANDCFPSNGRQ